MKQRVAVVPLVVAAMALSLTVSAALWQLSRGREKDRIASEIEAANGQVAITLGDAPVSEVSVRFRRVVATGRFDPQAMVLADNQIHRRTAGYNVYMPLLLTGTDRAVLVKRGWIAAGPDRQSLPEVFTPRGELQVEGVALPANRRFLELSSDAQRGVVWQNVTVERFLAAHPMPLHAFVIEQHGPLPDDGLTREWPRPESGAAKHYGYAFQWTALSALIVYLTVFFHVRRTRSSETPPS